MISISLDARLAGGDAGDREGCLMKSGWVAFAFWCGGLIGICGLHCFYTGRTGSGFLWLFTLGLLGVGQFVDLFLLGKMVREANLLRSVGGPAHNVSSNSNVVAPIINVHVRPDHPASQNHPG